jgi:hypothetical protein
VFVTILLCQLVVVALLGAEYVVLALWDSKRPNLEDRYKVWRDDMPTHTTLGKYL